MPNLVAGLVVLLVAADGDEAVVLGPEARVDRLVTIHAARSCETIAEVSIDGSAWRTATVYPGTSVEQWRATRPKTWNAASLRGELAAGKKPVLWNPFFDVELPAASARLRLKAVDEGHVFLEQEVDLSPLASLFVVDHRNAARLAGGRLPSRWSLAPSDLIDQGAPSLMRKVDRTKVKLHGKYYRIRVADADPTPLVLHLDRKGWHRVYIGMEPYSACRIWLSKDDVRYEVPNYYQDGGGKEWADKRRFRQEFYVCSTDLTGQDLCIAPGGTRFWRDVSVRYVRCVPMTKDEIEHHTRVRKLARVRGRPFMGYLEPCTPLSYEPDDALGMRQHIRNEIRLNQARGSTEVFVHVIRIGSKAWYHSDVVERDDLPVLLRGDDPLAVAVKEARAAGLGILADFGMNATYVGSRDALSDRFAREHPELLCPKYTMCFDYGKPAVQEYVCSIVREVMTRYDVDGVHLDFARWGHRPAYDVPSLVAVLERINRDRRTAEAQWGHPLVISARVDYDPPGAKGEDSPLFVEAVRRWARAGLIDRVMANGHKRVSPATRLTHYVEALSGTNATLWADLYWGNWHEANGGPMVDVSVARAWVKQGLDGGFSYYMRARPIEWERINWQLRLVDFPDVRVDPHVARASCP